MGLLRVILRAVVVVVLVGEAIDTSIDIPRSLRDKIKGRPHIRAQQAVINVQSRTVPIHRPLFSQTNELQTNLERHVRRLSAALVGLNINGMLSIVLPHCLFGTAINGIEVFRGTKKVWRAIRDLGGVRRTWSSVCIRSLVAQICAGASIKIISTILFLGTEVDTWFENIRDLIEGLGEASPEVIEMGRHNWHERALEHHPLAETTAAASYPAGLVKEAYGDDPGLDITWGLHRPAEEVIAVGAVAAGTDAVLSKMVEDPLDKGAAIATGARRSH